MLQISRIDAFVGDGLLRIEAVNRKVKAQAIFFGEDDKRASADTMNLAVGVPAGRITQVAETLASLLDPEDKSLAKSIEGFIRSSLLVAESQPLKEREEKAKK